jgi:hypothetical protein
MLRPAVLASAILAYVATLTIVTLATSQRRTEPTMHDAAQKFLATLEPAQTSKALHPFNSEERLNWHFVPKDRKGIPFKELKPAQREAALTLLRVSLSQQGFEKVETIRSLENILREIEQGRGPVRDPELFYFAVFGKPSTKEAWGWRYEGHHISLNWTFIGGKVIASSPQFLGSNPGEVKEGPMKGTRVLAAEEDLGRALVKSLDEAQRKEAVLKETAPSDILTGNQREAAIQEDRGVAYKALNKEQQGILLTLIQEHANVQKPEMAKQRLDALRKAGMDTIKFAWMGGLERGQGHYYRIQGKTFLVEFDNTQNNANHIHTVWRDFKGDFGRDFLAEHYKEFPHPHQH